MKIKKLFTIILLAASITWCPNLNASNTDSQITSTFTLIASTPPARNLQLSYQPITNNNPIPHQPLITPQINTNPFRFEKIEYTLYNTSLITLAALNVADYFSTREALKHQGLSEANPLMKPFVKNDLTFAAVKLGITLTNHLFMKNLYKRNKTLAWVLSIASNLAMSYVVSHNLKMINSIQKK